MRPRRSRGFTLIELVAVLTILALVATSAGFVYDGGPARRIAAAALAVRQDIEYARTLAVQSGAPVTVRFPLDPPYLYRVETGGSIVEDPRTGRPFVIDLRSRTGSASTLIELREFGGDIDLTFSLDGAPVAPGSVIVAAGGLRFRVSVAAVTGRVTVVEL